MSQKQLEIERTRWHVADWPPLAWLETVIKLMAIFIGAVALVRAVSGSALGWPGGARLAQLIILFVLSSGLVAAIFDRWRGREIVAMVFVLLNNAGHWGMVIALASRPGPGALLLAFAGLMLVGDLVKLLFFKVHDFSVVGIPKSVSYGLISVYVAGYLVMLLLELS